MKLDMAGVVRDAWALTKRDRDLLFRIAGPFLFLPVYALYIAVPSPPDGVDRDASEAVQMAWIQRYVDWAGANGGWYIIATLLIYFGLLVILSLYLDAARPDLRTALARALRLFPRYLGAMLLMGIPAGLGMLLFLIPGLYVLGRMVAIGPVLVVERPIGALAAIGRSIKLTRGYGLVLMALSALTLVGGGILAEPFLAIDRALKDAGAGNPVALAVVDAGAAAATAASLLAMVMLQIAVYRRIGAKRGI